MSPMFRKFLILLLISFSIFLIVTKIPWAPIEGRTALIYSMEETFKSSPPLESEEFAYWFEDDFLVIEQNQTSNVPCYKFSALAIKPQKDILNVFLFRKSSKKFGRILCFQESGKNVITMKIPKDQVEEVTSINVNNYNWLRNRQIQDRYKTKKTTYNLQ